MMIFSPVLESGRSGSRRAPWPLGPKLSHSLQRQTTKWIRQRPPFNAARPCRAGGRPAPQADLDISTRCPARREGLPRFCSSCRCRAVKAVYPEADQVTGRPPRGSMAGAINPDRLEEVCQGRGQRCGSIRNCNRSMSPFCRRIDGFIFAADRNQHAVKMPCLIERAVPGPSVWSGRGMPGARRKSGPSSPSKKMRPTALSLASRVSICSKTWGVLGGLPRRISCRRVVTLGKSSNSTTTAIFVLPFSRPSK